MSGLDLGMSGLASGFDWKSFIDQIIKVERAPQTGLRSRQSRIQQQNTAYAAIETRLKTLQERLTALRDPAIFDSRSAQSSDTTAATATVKGGALTGTFTFEISRLASSSRMTGTANIASNLNATADVSALTLSDAGWPNAITDGTFTVNGKQVAVATSDTLQQVFEKIATATGNQVSASYDPATDKISLTSGGEIVLGSATDTSSFLHAARLANNGTGLISSQLALGSIRLDATLSNANFTEAVSDGGSGAGEFKINGVSIAFNASTDTVAGLLERINNSAAGASARYDTLNDRFVLTSKATGDMGIALEDVTGNFLAASGLSAGTLARGQDLLYTVNGGEALTSQSNTITDATSGITGLSVTALRENTTVTVTVGSDTEAVQKAVQGFVEAYNDVQSYLDTQTASTTDSKGAVTAGLLAGDSTASALVRDLRNATFFQQGATGTIRGLADLGYQTSGYDNKITLAKPELLQSALEESLPAIREFFAHADTGVGAKLEGFLTKILGETGEINARQDSLTRQVTDIDTQIARMEKTILANQKRLTDQFVAMEAAQARINQQLQYLLQNFQ